MDRAMKRWVLRGLVGCRKSFDRLRGILWLGRIFGRFHGRIEALEFGPGHVGAELPVDFGLALVAGALPSGALRPPGVDVR